VISLFAGGHDARASQDIYRKAARSSDPGHEAVRRREGWQAFLPESAITCLQIMKQS
jgi:hypothetical protein